MRIGFTVLLIIVIGRMIYDLTFNPIEAIVNLLGIGIEEPKITIRRALLITFPILTFVVLWSMFVPNIIAYYNQPFKTETHILSQMPMYGNDYITVSDHLFIKDTYKYMIHGEQNYRETEKSVKAQFTQTQTNTQTVTITYQEPKEKSSIYFFMDRTTWPMQYKVASYQFDVIYE